MESVSCCPYCGHLGILRFPVLAAQSKKYDAAMLASNENDRRQLESLERPQLERRQLERLNRMLQSIVPANRFYARRLGETTSIRSLSELRELPLTAKADLVPSSDATRQHARHLTFPAERYSRFHRTSGTQGHPLVIMDTAEDWQWWIETWQYVLDAANITSHDRVMMAFSFGPFIGFWSANDALIARGALVIPGGGLSTAARLQLILDEQATAVCCTPSYALHLAAVAQQEQLDLADSAVQKLIVAGEPGGSMPAIRSRITEAWHAEVIDHAGATEIGPWGYADLHQTGLHIVESEFIAEFLPLSMTNSPDAHRETLDFLQAADLGEMCELILTNLGRFGAPLLRYRTGDLVQPALQPSQAANRFAFLRGGVLGRVDNMMIVRGVNVYPSAIEQILREQSEIVEYRLTVFKQGEMDALRIEMEVAPIGGSRSTEDDTGPAPTRSIEAIVKESLRVRLGLHVDVQCVATGSLPRFELKGRRFVDER